MAGKKQTNQIIGIALLIAGVALIVWGYQIGSSISGQIGNSLTGSIPDGALYRYIAGAVAAVAGIFLLKK